MLQTLLGRKKYEEVMSDEDPQQNLSYLRTSEKSVPLVRLKKTFQRDQKIFDLSETGILRNNRIWVI